MQRFSPLKMLRNRKHPKRRLDLPTLSRVWQIRLIHEMRLLHPAGWSDEAIKTFHRHELFSVMQPQLPFLFGKNKEEIV